MSSGTHSLSLVISFLLLHSWPFFVKCSLKVRFAFIHQLGSHLLLNHLRPKYPPGHQLDRYGKVLCALCFSLQTMAAWNSSISPEKWADLRCPTQDVPWDRVRMLGCSLLYSDGLKAGSRSCLCHLQYRGATRAMISLETPNEGCICSSVLNPETQPENSIGCWGFKKQWQFPSHLLLLWKCD